MIKLSAKSMKFNCHWWISYVNGPYFATNSIFLTNDSLAVNGRFLIISPTKRALLEYLKYGLFEDKMILQTVQFPELIESNAPILENPSAMSCRVQFQCRFSWWPQNEAWASVFKSCLHSENKFEKMKRVRNSETCAFRCWSPSTGMTINGIPAVTDSMVLPCPQWVMKSDRRESSANMDIVSEKVRFKFSDMALSNVKTNTDSFCHIENPVSHTRATSSLTIV